ncbi:TVP38/TMEM64 family protein [Streptomyces sp. ISL-112]|uniref:TVP38/TMEM64 family protein n=1 Tax=unclassified Streptomyces TaxID=2593676 RepID=UPI001BE52A95|nr:MULTISPECIES: TVP38/TMEM64 family protein [unclassified Streptomyces]MBT2429733.1 TVP38/TMEM64 family protein [Streptomyces sp. ISL-112]MBT2464850.1 TVP38/TMEM64 family protein [Streptomyces sp. ISL-63]
MNRPAARSSTTGLPPPATDPDKVGRRPAHAAWIRLAFLVALLLALGSWVALGGGDQLRDVRQWVDSLGMWGPVVFAVIYALAVTALLPGSVLTASAGVLFGLPVGACAVLVGATAGAALSFGLARWLGRPAVARYAGSGRMARLDAYLTRRGFAAVLLVRLVPLFPFSVINYGAGVAGVRFPSYVTATALGIIPGTLVYTGLGGSLGDPGSPGLWIALGALLVLSAGGWWAARGLRPRIRPAPGRF